MMIGWCKDIWKEPGSAALSIDSPQATIARWKLIREKSFLREIYVEWYRSIASSIPAGEKPALELGSGAGFMSEFVPNLITSDVLELPDIDRFVDGCKQLPFENDSLRAIAMVNVFHHLQDCEVLLEEAQRCIMTGGVLSMVEPWVTAWSSIIYSHLHHEPFMPESLEWSFESSGPLSGANQALPWIVFSRDRSRFENAFPQLRIKSLELMMPLRYLLSGGLSYKAFVPFWSYRFWSNLEKSLRGQMTTLALFAHIVIEKSD